MHLQDIDEFCSYIGAQKNICLSSELFSKTDLNQKSKVIMLFAELFAFLCKKYDVTTTKNMIIRYQNTHAFKEWFWRIKHRLGNIVVRDPNFNDIGKWIGMGLFAKICYSALYYHNIYFDEQLISSIIDKQKSFLTILDAHFAKGNYVKTPVTPLQNGYILLKEKTILSTDTEIFHQTNIISK